METEIVLRWIDNGNESQIKVPYRNELFIEPDTPKSYCVRFKNVYDSYIIEYETHYNKDEYYYYTKHRNGYLIECGLVKADEYIPFKVFENNEIMKEYVYEFNNDNIDIKTRKEIYKGKYINNPKKRYPRVLEEETLNTTKSEYKKENEIVSNEIQSKPSIKPENASKTVSTETLINTQNNPKSIENKQFNVIDNKLVMKSGYTFDDKKQYGETILEFEESYRDIARIDFIINKYNFGNLRTLIFGNYTQFGVKGTKLEICGLSKLETIKIGIRAFSNYELYIFRGLIMIIL